MKMSKAIEGCLLALRADGYSPRTVELYRYVLNFLADYLKDPDVEAVRPQDLARYFVYLQDEYEPNGRGGCRDKLSGGTLQNHWKATRTFFRWASVELRLKSRPDYKLKLPSNNPKVVQPFTKDEVRALLDAAEFTRQASTNGRSPFKMRRRTADRDLALMLLMLDTGLRAGEVGRLNCDDLDMSTGRVYVAPFGSSNRKTKSREVFCSKSTVRAIWRYLAARQEPGSKEPLFLSERSQRVNANTIRNMLRDLGEKCGVKNVHPHRFRHTFAIEYLRNGGDVFTLQRLLGHTSLKMVLVYLQLAQADIQKAHQKASPVDNWKL